MDIPLLATKLFVPSPRPGLVERPRLVERLNAAFTAGLVLVSAPAGFGKTTVVSQWIAGRTPLMPVAWVQLDEGDNDPVRFWDYFIGALKTLRPAVGDGASTMLHAPQPYAIEAILTSLLNDLAIVPDDCVLVMDDYHLIKTDQVHDAVAYFVDHCPPKMHLIIATRVDPRLPLTRWQGRGSMVQIGADDLRFTSDEAATLLKMQDVSLDEKDLGALNEHAEGWVVGLKLAAMAMRGRRDASQFVASFTGSQRYIMDYLVEEVLARQPEDVRRFLLSTSVLERMTAPLCDAVTGASDGRTMLARLEQSNLFLVPLDDSRQWYRYHHLFAELLRHQAEIVSEGATVTQLHEQASRWYEEHSFIDDAVHHALAARDWKRGMKLVGRVAEDRFKHGEIVTVFEWLRAIPESILSTDFDLYRQYSRALIEVGHLDAGEAVLRNLARAARGEANLEGEVAAMQADVAQKRGNIPRAIEIGEKALALLSPDNLVYRCWTSYRLGFSQHYLGFLNEAWTRLTQAFDLARQSGDRYTAAWSANFLAAILHQRGDLRRALDMARQGLEIAGQTPAASGPNCRLAIIPYELNDLKTAAASARLAVDWNRLTGDSATIIGYVYLALALFAGGDANGAVEAMDDCDRALRDPKITPLFHARHAAARVIFAIRQGDLEAASKWGHRLADYSDCYPFEFAHVPARLLIAEGKKSEAAELLRAVHERAMRVGAHGFAIGIRVCQALAAENEDEALAFLSEALVKGERQGYVRTFVDEGRLLAPLLRRAMARGVTPRYAASLLQTIEAEEHRQRAAEQRGATGASGPLSERETEILRLIEAGLSNRQIAERLVISLATAKTHVHNICQKLSATTRTHALARAREMKLI